MSYVSGAGYDDGDGDGDGLLLTINLGLFSEMVERGGYTSLDLLDGDCVPRPQVIQYHRKQSAREVWMKKHKSLGFPCC